MFYLIQHIWFCLLLAAALGAFLMWLVRAWAKEEKLSEMVDGWESRLGKLQSENNQLKAQVQSTTGKLESIPTLEREIQRQQKEYATLSTQHREAEGVWSKKIADAERGETNKTAALETKLVQVRDELTGLANERDSLVAQCAEHARQLSSFQAELQESKKESGNWRERFAARDGEANESLIRLTAVTSELDRLREATQTSALLEEELETLRNKLGASEQELSSLRSDIAYAEQHQNEWREKWHDAEDRHARNRGEIDQLQARLEKFAETEVQANRYQAEAAALTQRNMELESQIGESNGRLDRLTAENDRLREEAQAAGRSNDQSDLELRARMIAAEEEAIKLRSHLSTASFLQDEWRAKWHAIEDKFTAAQTQISELTARVGALTGFEIENTRLQTEVANWSSKYTLLQAEADLQYNKVKELTDRLAGLAPAPPHREDRDNGWQTK